LEFSLEETKDLLVTLDTLDSTADAGVREELVERLTMYLEGAKARVEAVREQLSIAEGFASDLRSEVARQKRATRRA
jgi:MerR family copper efflux transcriptional regulator